MGRRLAIAPLLAALAIPGAVLADDASGGPDTGAVIAAAHLAAQVTGTYKAKFEEVANNCTQVSINLDRGTVDIEQKGRRATVHVKGTPVMRGTFSKGNRFRVKAKRGPTSIRGVNGKFSAAGRVDDGLLQMVFIAELYNGNKPLCTQSWNVSGTHESKVE